MHGRLGNLIGGCSDEIILESTLVINDELNSLFVRYERWLKNSAAAKAQGNTGTLVSSTGVATTDLSQEVSLAFQLLYVLVAINNKLSLSKFLSISSSNCTCDVIYFPVSVVAACSCY